MKIGILTQPLHTNYGGLLQAYALQRVLKDMGHEVLTVDIPSRQPSLYKKYRGVFVRSIKKYVLKNKGLTVLPSTVAKEQQIISQYTHSFIRKNITLTKHLNTINEIHLLDGYHFDTYIVGSDQVWRPKYSPGLKTYFLDFLKQDKKIKRIAYAASLGTDKWELTDKETTACGSLLRKFDAVSVREDSAVGLIKQKFDCNAELVLDPTLLLNRDDYIKLSGADPVKNGSAMIYILDKTPERLNIVKQITDSKNLTVNEIMPNKWNKNTTNIEDRILPKVEDWIKGFMNASYVITDSFHGTAFSILFNKPFIALGNKARGLSRFNSLLKLFGLEDRLVCDIESFDIKYFDQPINYDKVNKKLDELREESFKYLNDSLRCSK